MPEKGIGGHEITMIVVLGKGMLKFPDTVS